MTRHYQVHNPETGLWKKVELETGIVVASSRQQFEGVGLLKTEEQLTAIEQARRPKLKVKPSDPLSDFR